MEKLLEIINELNDYKSPENNRPSYAISEDKKRVIYYRKWSDRYPESELEIDEALKCDTSSELQQKLGI